MRPRLTAPVTLLTFATLALLAAVVFGFLAVAFYPMSGAQLIATVAAVIGGPFRTSVTVLVLGSLCGALTWTLLFVLQRDGFHRLEWVAMQPRNYGGRSPFETGPRKL